MKYQRISNILKNSLPAESGLRLTKKQVESFKSAAQITLGIIMISGVATVSLIAPNLLQTLKPLLKKKKHSSKKQDHEEVAKVFYYLKRHGLIKFKPVEGDVEVFLTDLGKKRLKSVDFNTLAVPKAKEWNGRWWQVAADVPTLSHRTAADLMRRKLRQMRFYPLQRSLWFYPFDPRQEIEFICQHYGVERFVTVMEVYRMDVEDEEKLKEHFKTEGIL